MVTTICVADLYHDQDDKDRDDEDDHDQDEVEKDDEDDSDHDEDDKDDEDDHDHNALEQKRKWRLVTTDNVHDRLVVTAVQHRNQSF